MNLQERCVPYRTHRITEYKIFVPGYLWYFLQAVTVTVTKIIVFFIKYFFMFLPQTYLPRLHRTLDQLQ